MLEWVYIFTKAKGGFKSHNVHMWAFQAAGKELFHLSSANIGVSPNGGALVLGTS
jgi:hypothetical protein